MVSEVPAVKAVRVSLALSHGHGPRVQAVKDRRSWYGHQHGQYRRPLVSCSCSPLLLLCSGIEMRLLFAALPSLSTSDHLFWGILSSARCADLSASPHLEVALRVSSPLLQSAPTRFPAHLCQETKKVALSAREAAASLFDNFNSGQRTSVLEIAWRLIAG
jgi:hypothetical protein